MKRRARAIPVAQPLAWSAALASGAARAAGEAADPLGYQALLRLSAGLLVVVVLVFAAAWAVRRFARLPGSAGGAVQLLGGLALGQRERVVLVRVGGERLLLGVAPGRVSKLHTLAPESAEELAPAAGETRAPDFDAAVPGQSFAHKLGALIRGEVRP